MQYGSAIFVGDSDISGLHIYIFIQLQFCLFFGLVVSSSKTAFFRKS